jgi:hypothetical protein
MPKKGGKLKKKSNFGMKKRKKSGKKNEKVKKKKECAVFPHTKLWHARCCGLIETISMMVL